MELEILQVLVILLSVVVIAFLILSIIAVVVVLKLVKKISLQLDKTGTITDNIASFTAGMTKLGMPVMVTRILFGLARKAMSRR